MTPLNEQLKQGNPALSEEAAQWGLRRAREVYKAHGDPQDGLRLGEIHLAAIMAGAYQDGRGDKPEEAQKRAIVTISHVTWRPVPKVTSALHSCSGWRGMQHEA